MNLTTELRPGIDQVGYVDYNVRDFHSYDTQRGATYNAYLVRDEKIALIDTVKAPFAAQLKRNVASLADLEKVDYLVCLHAELDHAGSLPAMVAACPNATVVCNAKCKDALAKVVLGFSGGVDSAVCAALLKKEGYEVHGLYLDNTDESSRRDAETTAAYLGIDLRVLAIKPELEEKVCRPFAASYLRGETPNPCILCNPTVKFKALLAEASEKA